MSLLEVDSALIAGLVDTIAAAAATPDQWQNPTHVAYAAAALRLAGRPEANALFSRSLELVETGPGARLQRASACILGQAFRPTSESKHAMQLIGDVVRREVERLRSFDKLWTFVIAQALDASARAGPPNKRLKDELLARRLNDGSFEQKAWVTAFGLNALFHSHVKGRDIQDTRSWLEAQLRNDHYPDDSGVLTPLVSTGHCVLALLNAGSGENHPSVAKAVWWMQRQARTADDPLGAALTALVLILIDRNEYVRQELKATDVVIDQTTVNRIYQENYQVHGDLIQKGGRKVEVKDNVISHSALQIDGEGGGGGATTMKDNVVSHSQVAVGGGARVEDNLITHSRVGGAPPAGRAVKFCPECGADLRASPAAKFCQDCGTDLRAGGAAP